MNRWGIRPVWVKRKKKDEPKRALFHCWFVHAFPKDEVLIGEKGGQFYDILALVEFEDGTVERVKPTSIKFADGGAFSDYVWLPFDGGSDDGTVQEV